MEISIKLFKSLNTLGILSDTASYPLVGRAEVEVYGVPLAEFQFSQHGVPAELIASVHEFFQAEGGDLVAGHAAAGAEAFAFAGMVSSMLTRQRLVVAVLISAR